MFTDCTLTHLRLVCKTCSYAHTGSPAARWRACPTPSLDELGDLMEDMFEGDEGSQAGEEDELVCVFVYC